MAAAGGFDSTPGYLGSFYARVWLFGGVAMPLFEKLAEPAVGIADTEGKSGSTGGQRFMEQSHEENMALNPDAKHRSQGGTGVEAW